MNGSLSIALAHASVDHMANVIAFSIRIVEKRVTTFSN